MTNILTRYQNFKKAEEELTHVTLHEKLASEYPDVCTADEITKIIQSHFEETNIKQLDVIGLNQLEQQMDSFLHQVRTRKKQLNMGVVNALQDQKQLNMGVVNALQDQEMELKKERKFLMEEIKAARMNEVTDESGNA